MNSPKVKARMARNRKELEEIFKIRKQVFMVEQNVPEKDEWDGFDKESRHAILLSGKKPIGCARIRLVGKIPKLERIAILKGCRKKGYGKGLTQYLLSWCKKQNYKTAVIYSQSYAIPFYEKLGFIKKGKEFMEAGIKHCKMHIRL